VGWWSEVHRELVEVLRAPTVNQAAAIINWWHADWSAVGDSAKEAATRLREAARAASCR
jgi:hypothetical protein